MCLKALLGTIGADADILPDVWSYPEDDMVIDSLLDEHLAHWGLDRFDLIRLVVLVEFLGKP